ncbi:hypothetical protein HH310_30180 [Actinoplanes sp. TBRC 11911]|uniref:CHASE domain-containing protein n=1 Tax=Actinoplanes sp. TBRC 11911 TaxID=2729386 RepID=UPI00145C872C|nr:CHASE domain-containing protein [Actinoplanes sp. TBRC 11911]NMO55438.1 hypothetical protein [Actinoplanes sp. TBRC 11911]
MEIAERGRQALALAVVVAGLAGTALTSMAIRADQRETAETVMDQRTAAALAAVRTEAGRYRALLEATAAGLALDDRLSWDDFDAATAPLAAAGLSGATSVAYVVPARTADIAAVQRRWRERGATGLVLQPAPARGEHYFSIFTRPLGGTSASPDGLDAGASPEAAEALEGSRSSGQPSVSDAYGDGQGFSFVFAAPLWTRASRPEFRGWLVAGLRGPDFLSGLPAAAGLNAELLPTGRPLPGRPGLERRGTVEVADRQWTLITRAASGGRTGLPLTVLIGGCVLTLTVAGLVHALATARRRAVRTVRRQAALLSERAELEELTRHAPPDDRVRDPSRAVAD